MGAPSQAAGPPQPAVSSRLVRGTGRRTQASAHSTAAARAARHHTFLPFKEIRSFRASVRFSPEQTDTGRSARGSAGRAPGLPTGPQRTAE